MLFCVLGGAECLKCVSFNAKGNGMMCVLLVVPFVQNRKKEKRLWVLCDVQVSVCVGKSVCDVPMCVEKKGDCPWLSITQHNLLHILNKQCIFVQ